MPDIQNGDIVIHYEAVGAGAPLLCLHGMWSSHTVFQKAGWVDAFAADHRLLLPDIRGHGASAKPHDTAAYASDRLVADALAVLDAEGVATAQVLGYSMGGWIAYALACTAPERVRTLVVGGAGLDPQHTHSAAALRFSLRALEQGLDVLIRTVTLPNLDETMRAQLMQNDPEALRALMVAWIGGPAKDLDALAAVSCPALVFAGDCDPYEKAARACAAALVQGRFVLLPGHTHDSALLQGADAIAVVREFLSEAKSDQAPTLGLSSL